MEVLDCNSANNENENHLQNISVQKYYTFDAVVKQYQRLYAPI